MIGLIFAPWRRDHEKLWRGVQEKSSQMAEKNVVHFPCVFQRFDKIVVHFPSEMFNFDGFHNVFGGPGNSPADPADLPETVSGPPEQTLGSPRRGSG